MMKRNNKRRIAVTVGNPNGIGPEITSKALENLTKDELEKIYVIGSDQVFENLFFSEHLELISAGNGSYTPGLSNDESGFLSYLFLKKTEEMIKKNQIDTVVTAPISKYLINSATSSNFTDHTSFYSSLFPDTHSSMLFYGKKMNVILATIHIPLSDVPKKLTVPLIRNTILNGVEFMKYLNIHEPKTAVCGLNPHAGEQGLLGKEDIQIITPAINELSEQIRYLSGPVPGDTAFIDALKKKYDLVVAMYHDQALAPFKVVHFSDGVNVTLGLPIIRTSPDHGTAFEIAGKNKADSTSMLEALRLAFRIRSQRFPHS